MRSHHSAKPPPFRRRRRRGHARRPSRHLIPGALRCDNDVLDHFEDLARTRHMQIVLGSTRSYALNAGLLAMVIYAVFTGPISPTSWWAIFETLLLSFGGRT